MKKNYQEKINSAGTLGTFSGVFTPSILTILGIILFLRLGYVVGSAGLANALIIIVVANFISVLTSFSLAAIATNIRVKGGGDYYLISRTLGISFGGSLGLVLFLAQSISIAFYCIGFGEVLSKILIFSNSSIFLPQIIAAIAVLFLFIFAWLGSDWTIKFQYVIMVMLILALVSFYIGGIIKWDSYLLEHNWNTGANSSKFWILFAIFFPAVTGFTQGVSMSGDLKDPSKNIPFGTFMAVGISILIYFSIAVVLSASIPNEKLVKDYGAMKKIAYWGYLIDAGVLAATLSSAMASFMGAPRILQALAKDKIFPFLLPFAKGFGPINNPRRGILLSAAIAFGIITFGHLDLIARIVSMFFLISYGLLNYATYFEAKTGSPSFRPRFKLYHPSISLTGFLACFGAMLSIDLKTGIIAIAILFTIYKYLQITSDIGRWSDSRRSNCLQRIRENLMEVSCLPEHSRDWRPYILALSENPERRKRLLYFASWIEGGSGITTVVKFFQGEGLRILKEKKKALKELRKEIMHEGINAFPLVVFTSNLEIGIETTLQTFGIGPIHINTILINWLDYHTVDTDIERKIRYDRNLKAAFQKGCNIIILDAKANSWNSLKKIPRKERRIDIWWWNGKNGNLMLLLAYLLTRHTEWHESKICILAANYKKNTNENFENLKKIIDASRIVAECRIIENPDAIKMANISKDATLVFMPLKLIDYQPVDLFGGVIDNTLSFTGITSLVLAAEDVDLDAEPEDGIYEEISRVLDQMEKAEKMLHHAKKEAFKASENAVKKMEEIELSGKKIDSALEVKYKEAIKARKQKKLAERRVKIAQEKSEDATMNAETLGIPVKKHKENINSKE